MRFALLDCEDSEKWRGHEEIWLRLFKREGDEWDVFRVYNGELPSNSQYKGILITGSHYSCYDELPWIEPLSQYLHDLHSKPEDSRPKVYATCFGCQVLAHALGGTVRKNPSGRFVFGSAEVEGTPSLAGHPFFQTQQAEGEAPQQTTFRLLESHGDCVTALPNRDDVILLASSESCEVEIYCVGRSTIAVQGHPELTKELVEERILPSLRPKLTESELQASLESLSLDLDDAAFLALAKRFLRS